MTIIKRAPVTFLLIFNVSMVRLDKSMIILVTEETLRSISKPRKISGYSL
jgi:hypothetical protein